MKDEKVPDFPTHVQRASYLQSRKNLIMSEAIQNVHQAGSLSARIFWKRMAEDKVFALRVVNLAK